MKKPKKGDIVAVTLYLEVESVDQSGYISAKDVFTKDKINLSDRYIPFFKNGKSYVKVVKTTRTELVNRLSKCEDEIFTVQFTKLNGKVRVLTGRKQKEESNMGRTLAWDLNKKGLRYVDHRTLESIIVDNVKYILKDEHKEQSRMVRTLQ